MGKYLEYLLGEGSGKEVEMMEKKKPMMVINNDTKMMLPTTMTGVIVRTTTR